MWSDSVENAKEANTEEKKKGISRYRMIGAIFVAPFFSVFSFFIVIFPKMKIANSE
jgi:hypothetical protein